MTTVHASSSLSSPITMPFRFRTRLARFISRFKTFMSTELTSTPQTLFPDAEEQYHVSSWAAIALLPHNITLARASMVTYVRHYKLRTGACHEALQLQIAVPVTDHQAAHNIYLFVDRTGGEPPSASSSLSSLPTSLTRLPTQSGNLSSSYAAVDRILVSAHASGPPDGYEIISTLQLPPNTSFSVVHAIALFRIVSTSRVIYNFLTANCYWFAAGIYHSVASRYTTSLVLGDSEMIAGQWHSIKVGNESPQDKLAFLGEIQRAWQVQIDEYALLPTEEQVNMAKFLPRCSNST